MAKRAATTVLNHENWDDDEPSEPTPTGKFERASDDTLNKRVIKVARRRITGGAESDQANTKNAFAAFQGFTKKAPSSEVKSTFGFLNSMSNTQVNGVQNQLSTTNKVDSPILETTDSKSDNTYPAKLVRLNQCVSEWIKSHVDKDPSCILTPIFKDYERYLKEIEEEKSSSETVNKATTMNVISAKPLLFGSDKSASSNFKFNLPSGKASSVQDVKGTSGSPSASKGTDSLFSTYKADNIQSSGLSTVLKKPDQQSLMVNPFLNKLNKSENEDSSKKDIPTSGSAGFTLGSGKMFSFGNTSEKTKSEDNDGGQEEDTDEPPKVDFTPVKEESVYNIRCKVFVKKTDYADMGVGTLYIKAVQNEKHQLIVRADTSLGNILINVLLNSSIPAQRMGKNNVMIVCIPLPSPAESNSPAAPTPVLLRVKTPEEADDLLKAIEKYKNKS